ncbi:TetR/AcrR family transcriptional regulator [Mycobacterium sherrisii]|uniref:TetR/AcrR family transcriptional regulator n=1 Tax=Mycobacterium sherrisii TaxID=243061 RepID=UPI000A160F5C|nr:TetR/AcrR family transcriptional regulator [Mycobacterium sherrisii]MCV7029756.1 TetR/AcrR family transcriptional regulator [Mycobacterium sherrisii]ORW75032.1 TetR family transcriptional regulator [Mycobacterium sherrisii]
MPIEDRRARERAARHRLIIATARRLAETEGWDAVTTRRLSAEIEYSQPVLYTHFANMEQLAQAVALDGFGELAETLQTARTAAATPADALRRVAQTYLDFGRHNPALYDVMFTRATTLHFAADDTPPELVSAFTELRDAIAAAAEQRDPDTLAEVLWSALHGLVTLSRTSRLRPDFDADRLDLLLTQLSAHGAVAG